jgi:uncharacterized protein (TIGR00297 family)
MPQREQNLFAAPSPSDWQHLGMVIAGAILFLGLTGLVRNSLKWPASSTRKLNNLAVGVLASFTPQLFSTAIPALLFGLWFLVTSIIVEKNRFMKGTGVVERVSYGTVFFTVAYVILVVLFWTKEPAIIVMSMLVLAFGDSAAALAGESNKSAHEYQLTSDKKSFEGSLAMFVVSFMTLFAGIHHFGIHLNLPLNYALGLSLSGAATATAWEALSSRGLDNLTIPLSVAFILSCYIYPSFIDHKQLSLGVSFGIVIAVASFYWRLLSRSGAVATFLLASLLYGVGGLRWTVPIVVFFVLSSTLSKIGKSRKAIFENVFEKSDERDYAQVAANGGVAGILIVLSYLFPHRDFYPLYLGSVAAVTADTWGTEIGLLTSGEPVLVSTLKRVRRGTNGGVTMIGFGAGILGAGLIGLCSWPWITGWNYVLKIVIAGAAGALIDSILGATVQAQYRCGVCNEFTERLVHHETGATLVRGYSWLNNDAVNWACAITGAFVMWLFYRT